MINHLSSLVACTCVNLIVLGNMVCYQVFRHHRPQEAHWRHTDCQHCNYGVRDYLTLGAHAQRGLQYLVCVSVCVCVCYFLAADENFK